MTWRESKRIQLDPELIIDTNLWMVCWFNGCCYGKETRSALGVVFPRFSTAWRAQLDAGHITAAQGAIPVHPTQLYEAAACLAISAILYFVIRLRKRHDFDVFAWL